MPTALRHLEDRLFELKHEAETLLRTLDQTTSELETALGSKMREQPYGVLAAAAVVGYVFGGGLPSPLTRLAFAIGGRIGIEYVWREVSARSWPARGPYPRNPRTRPRRREEDLS